MKLPVFLLLATVVASAATCGKTTPGANGDDGDTDLIIWVQCTPAADSAVTSARVYVGTYGSGHITAAVYASDGAGGQPKTQLCPGGAVTPPGSNGWVVVALTNCGTLLSGHTYWIGINEDGGAGGVQWRYDAGGSAYFARQNCCTWPATISGNVAIANTYSAYLELSQPGQSAVPRKHTGWIR